MTTPISRPSLTSNGVRGTAGRAPVESPIPTLSAEAAKLIRTLPTDADRLGDSFENLLQQIAAKPSRAGAEALTWLAAVYAEKNITVAESAMKLSAFVTESCARNEAAAKLSAGIAKLAEIARAAGYSEGWEAGQAALRAQLPTVIRETKFQSDELGHIVGKTEREFQTTGGKR